MEMLIIKEDSNEWNNMWDWLASHPLNNTLADPMVASHEGEAWQYMGSLRSQDGRVLHSFRHRNHPFDGNRKDVTVKASEAMCDDDIMMAKAVK